MKNMPFHLACGPLAHQTVTKVDKVPYNTINAAKIAVAEMMSHMNNGTIIKACSTFRSHLEAVVATDDGHIE